MRVRLNPDRYLLHSRLGHAYFATGRDDDALVAHRRAIERSQRLPLFAATLAIDRPRRGWSAEADVLWREVEERARREYVPAFCFMQMSAARGKLGAMLERLKKAIVDVLTSQSAAWLGVGDGG